MLKKTIKYVDYMNNERTEDFYFNLTKAEVLQMELGETGGLSAYMNKIIAAQDGPSIMAVFEKIIEMSYGEKSADGKYFRKRDDNGNLLFNKFKETEAYSVLFMELVTDADKASEFTNGIIPADVAKEVNKQLAANNGNMTTFMPVNN